MSSALEIAAVGMRAQQQALDVIANNISNVNTPAFKRSDMRFAELVSASLNPRNAEFPAHRRTDSVAGVLAWSQPLIDRQGQLEATDDPRNLAIDGAGFIELAGPAGRTLLWRGGVLRVLDDGSLAAGNGFALKAGISVPVDAIGFRIENDGRVIADMAGQEEDVELGTIRLVRAADPALLERMDGGIYALSDETGLSEAGAGEDGLGLLKQGSLERSNVDLNNEMVGLLLSQRAYAANAQVVRAADDLFAIANNLRR